ncbi:LOW QUALITY PROTEIN: zf-RVT domain-containing protein, partial [Cephalotus follicularis]
LCSRAMRARYFRNGNFLAASRGYNPSFIWSICATKKVLKRGLIWRIGNGIQTEISNDRWIPDMEETPKPSPANVLDQGARVCLIDWDNRGWRRDLIGLCFDEAMVNSIFSIALSHRLCDDRMIWSKHGSREYTVKTGYQIAHELKECVNQYNAQRGLWKWLWGLSLPHKIRHFGWKCCKRILPVNKNVGSRVQQVHPICSICQEEDETIMHAI